MQRRYRARTLQFQSAQAKTRESLGIRPEYGAPVLMPPSDRLSGALSIASTIVGIASGLGDLGMFSKGASKGLEGLTTPQLFGDTLTKSPLVNQPVGIGGYFTDINFDYG